jgi:Uma2 family endonuclease
MLTTLDEAALVALVEEEHYAMAGAAHHNFVIRLYEGLLVVFDGRDDVCVLAEVTTFGPDGQPFIPDIAVVHGVGQHEPSSWRQDHGDPPPTVVIEVVSPSENDDVLATKLTRFNDCGVEEVWLLRTRLGEITCYRRHEGTLRRIAAGSSALLGGVRFEVAPDGAIVPFFADGEEFPPHFVAILRRARCAEARATDAEAHAAAVAAQVLRLQDQLRAAGIEPIV